MHLCSVRLPQIVNDLLHVTRVRFDTTVNTYMFSKITESSKWFLTKVTCVLFNTMVNTFVFSEINELIKCFRTIDTLVRFISGMNESVCCQIAARSKLTYYTRHMCTVWHHCECVYECVCVPLVDVTKETLCGKYHSRITYQCEVVCVC